MTTTIPTARTFALVPAAGQSRRMGTTKLALPLGKRAVLEWVVDALLRPRLDGVLVVLGSSGRLLAPLIRPPARILVLDHDPPEMRMTIEAGLAEIERTWRPTAADAILIALGDHPAVRPSVIDLLVRAHAANPERICVPVWEGKRGHPVLFPWSIVPEVRSLPADQGLNALFGRFPALVLELAVPEADILDDLDTPEDYAKARRREWT